MWDYDQRPNIMLGRLIFHIQDIQQREWFFARLLYRMDPAYCPDTVHIFSVLCLVGWGYRFLDFVVRGSQAQIATSFVWASARFWRHIGRPRPRMRCIEIPFWYGCIYAEHRDTWALDVTLNLWYPAWCTRYGRYL